MWIQACCSTPSLSSLINPLPVLGIQDNMCMPWNSLYKATILTHPFFRCAVDIHLCGEPCKLMGKKGCLGKCTKV